MNPRPKKNTEDKQLHQMSFYCTDEEKKEIEILAKKHGYAKRTDYMRRVCLGYEQADRTELEKKKK